MQNKYNLHRLQNLSPKHGKIPCKPLVKRSVGFFLSSIDFNLEDQQQDMKRECAHAIKGLIDGDQTEDSQKKLYCISLVHSQRTVNSTRKSEKELHSTTLEMSKLLGLRVLVETDHRHF